MTLDVLIDAPFSFDLLWSQREIRKQEDLIINIVSLQHLIDMKKYSDRKQDNDDVLLLTKLLNRIRTIHNINDSFKIFLIRIIPNFMIILLCFFNLNIWFYWEFCG